MSRKKTTLTPLNPYTQIILMLSRIGLLVFSLRNNWIHNDDFIIYYVNSLYDSLLWTLQSARFEPSTSSKQVKPLQLSHEDIALLILI